jgi:hypothetical protein
MTGARRRGYYRAMRWCLSGVSELLGMGVGRWGVSIGLALACTPFEAGSDELDAETLIQQQSPEPGSGREWACLGAGEPTRTLVPAPIGRRLVQSIQILNMVNGAVIPELFVRGCTQRDVECTAPVTERLPVGADGWIDMPLYEGFTGYLEITGDTLLSTALFYPDPLVAGQEVYSTSVGLLERASVPSLTGATGTRQEDAFGLVVLRSLDCEGEGALGVRYSIDKPGSSWYFVDGLPSSGASETADSGLGGFINVAPGVAIVTAELSSAGSPIVAPTSVLVRAGWMTALRFVARVE